MPAREVLRARGHGAHTHAHARHAAEIYSCTYKHRAPPREYQARAHDRVLRRVIVCRLGGAPPAHPTAMPDATSHVACPLTRRGGQGRGRMGSYGGSEDGKGEIETRSTHPSTTDRCNSFVKQRAHGIFTAWRARIRYARQRVSDAVPGRSAVVSLASPTATRPSAA